MRWATAALAVGAVCLVACSGGGGSAPPGGADPPSCASVLASRCPSGAPSYRSSVEAIFATHCTPCHNDHTLPGYGEASYSDVFGRRSAILDQVNACAMPPLRTTVVPPLSEADRRTLLDWLVCNAPDN